MFDSFVGAGTVLGAGRLNAPSFIARGAIPNKEAEPPTEPHVVYAAAGDTITISTSTVPAFPYTAPVPFNATEAFQVPTVEGGNATVHVVPIRAPEPLPSIFAHQWTIEDRPIALRLLPGAGHTYDGALTPVVTSLPSRGRLFELMAWEDRSLSAPINESGHVLARLRQLAHLG